jgi:hypothetical protein
LSYFTRLYRLGDGSMREKAIQYFKENRNRENSSHPYLSFIIGDYEKVFNECQKGKPFKEWNYSTQDSMLPFFIALLFGKQPLPPVTVRLIKRNFGGVDYIDDFIEVLADSRLVLAEDERQRYFAWCMSETENRAAVILEKWHRRMDQLLVADLVVAMAELISAQDDYKKADDFIDGFLLKYPDCFEFQEEVQECAELAGF